MDSTLAAAVPSRHVELASSTRIVLKKLPGRSQMYKYEMCGVHCGDGRGIKRSIHPSKLIYSVRLVRSAQLSYVLWICQFRMVSRSTQPFVDD